MERFDEIVTDPSLRLADVSSFAASASPGALYRGRHRIFATSGSTGVPAVFVFAQDEFMEWVGVCLALLARHGVRPETRLAAIGAPADVTSRGSCSPPSSTAGKGRLVSR
jgi:hypothetical protein